MTRSGRPAQRPERQPGQGWLHGGPRIELYEAPDAGVLAALGFTQVNTVQVPHASDAFDPPLRLSLLLLEHGFVIAERVEKKANRRFDRDDSVS